MTSGTHNTKTFQVFISYNHNDQPVALKIMETLESYGFEVVIDKERMRAGQDIEQFILECIKKSGVTISLISSRSLLSSWVTMETLLSHVDVKLRERYYIPCYIDKNFFDRKFTTEALRWVETELAEIESIMKAALENGWGIEDLQSERTRLNRMKAYLPEIVGKLRNTLCIDLTAENFDQGMKKIVCDIKVQQQLEVSQQPQNKFASTANTDLKSLIANAVDEFSKQRLIKISIRLTNLNELLNQYEQAVDLETDPRRRTRYEVEIQSTKHAIEATLAEIDSLK